MRRLKWHKLLKSIIVHVLVIFSAVLIGFPFYYMISTSLKTLSEVYHVPMVLVPAKPQWANYVTVWKMLPFARFTLNSVIYTLSITMGEIVMGLMCGYAFARLRFPKKDLIFLSVVSTLMIPGHIVLVPRFILLHKLNWVDTYQGLIVPQLSSAFAVFMLKEHFQSLPNDLFEAAKIDGASHLRQLFQVALPISKPITITLVLLAFVSHWNAYMWPLIPLNPQPV